MVLVVLAFAERTQQLAHDAPAPRGNLAGGARVDADCVAGPCAHVHGG